MRFTAQRDCLHSSLVRDHGRLHRGEDVFVNELLELLTCCLLCHIAETFVASTCRRLVEENMPEHVLTLFRDGLVTGDHGV